MNDPLSPIKVSITRSKEITEHVPEDVSRDKAHVWLDIISPVTQWAGLKGDALRHKRQLMRLEQEASLATLAMKLKKKLEGKTVTPIAPKVLIPSLEKASLESPDSEVLEKWANLLASEALNPSDDSRTSAAILGDLGQIEASILDQIQKLLVDAGLWDDDKLATRYKPIGKFLKEIYPKVRSIMDTHAAGQSSVEESGKAIMVLVDKAPVWLTVFRLSRSGGEPLYLSIPFDDDYRVAFDILKYRNLLQSHDYQEFGRGQGLLTLKWLDLTHLGIRFLKRVSGQ